MRVLGKGVTETQFLHHTETQAIGERPGLVRVLQKISFVIENAVDLLVGQRFTAVGTEGVQGVKRVVSVD